MTETQTETAPDATVTGPDATSLLSEVLETTQEQEGQEQAKTETVKSDPKPEQTAAPESYEFAIPDGVHITKDAAPVVAYGEFAKEMGLSQEKAQAGLTKLVEAQAAHGKEQLAAMVNTWKEETRNDPEIGGEKLSATLVKANQVLSTLKTGPALRDLLESSQLGNHRAVIAALAEFRDVIGDDHFVAGNEEVAPQRRTPLDHFPNSPQLK